MDRSEQQSGAEADDLRPPRLRATECQLQQVRRGDGQREPRVGGREVVDDREMDEIALDGDQPARELGQQPLGRIGREVLERYAALAVAVLALAVFAPTASADPLNAKNSLAFPATCDNGQTVQVVVNGNGEISPAHVVGSTAVFVPQSFDITFEFTPPGGPTETETDTASNPNVHGDLVICSFDVTQSFPFGTLHLFGTATGFFTPAS